MRYVLKVVDMGCSHCKNAIKGRLSELEGVTEFSVNLDSKTVEVEIDLDLTIVLNAMDEIGYPAERL